MASNPKRAHLDNVPDTPEQTESSSENDSASDDESNDLEREIQVWAESIVKFPKTFQKKVLGHSVMGMVMTLEISNMDKIYIFGTLVASFFPKSSLPKSLLFVSPVLP